MDQINQAGLLHQAWLDATAFEVALNIVFERYWYEAIKWGIVADDVKLIVKSRLRGIAKGERREACILIRNICGSEEALAEVMEELGAIKAKLRMKILPAPLASVLRATGRSDQVPTPPAKLISDNDLIQTLRKAAG